MISTNANEREKRSCDSNSFNQDRNPREYGTDPNTSDVNLFQDFIVENRDMLHHLAHIVGNPLKLLIGILPKVSKGCGAAAEQALAMLVDVDVPFQTFHRNLRFEGMSAVIRRCPNIKKLTLERTTSADLNKESPFSVSPGQWHLFFNALKTNSVLQTLDLSKTGLYTGAKHLAEALMMNSTLKELNLNYNQLGPSGAKHVADALKTNSALQTLRLRGTEMCQHCMYNLSEAIKTNSTLTKLDLWNNSIGCGLGSKGPKHLSEALKTNSTLKKLKLNNNNLGANGAKHLSEALKTNSALQTLKCAAARPFLDCQ